MKTCGNCKHFTPIEKHNKLVRGGKHERQLYYVGSCSAPLPMTTFRCEVDTTYEISDASKCDAFEQK